nr:hypothetical protein [Tanacetum cinerariifolium]
MADVNVNALASQAPTMAPPVRTDDQILPRIRWVPIGKSNSYLDLDKSQSNPIYKIAMDLLKHTNFFRAFTASSTIPSIYIQQFWDTFQYDKLARKHKFHPRPDSPLHLSNEEPVLGYLKFSAKRTKREVFGMHIPTSLITADIQEASYYQEYLAKVAQHRWYLAGETENDPNFPAPKPTKPARKPKSTAPKPPPRPSVSKSVTSAQPKPKSVPAKTQGKKCKPTTDIFDKPSKATKSRHGFVSKKHTPISTLKSVDESVAEDVPAKEPQVDAEEANMQRALEESLKSMYDVPRGPLPPMVIREPESRKYQPLPEVSGNGKAKSNSEEESKKVMLEADAGGQGEGQAGPDPGAQAEGQAGPDPNPGNAGADEQPMSSHVVHDGSDREHMDLDVADVSPQPSTEQMDEGFTTTAYPKVQENLKLMVKEKVRLEEPASSGTLSSVQHLSKELSFGDLFFSDKTLKADHDKATTETEAESMVSVTIQQDMSPIPPMTSPIIDLTSRPESPKVHQLKATVTDITTTTTTLPPPPYQQQSTAEAMMMKRIGIPHQVSKAINEVVTDPIDWSMQAPLRNLFRDLLEANMKEILHQQIAKDLAEARKKKKKSCELPKMPPWSPHHQPPSPPPPSGPSGASGALGASGAPRASGSSQVPPPPPPSSSTNQENLQMDEDMALDEQAQSSDDKDIGSAHIPKTGDIATFMDWFCKRRGITKLKPQDLEGPAFEIIKVFHPDVIHLQYQMEECHKLLTDRVDDSILRHNVSKPLPLGGPPGQVTIQSDFFFNKDLEYLRYGCKGSRPALSISKIKAAYYPDVDLEQMVADQFWIEEECKYNIVGMYDSAEPHQISMGCTGFEYKHDYTVIDSPRDVTFQDRCEAQMMMRFNKIHKFSDGTLQQIDEALDYRVKEFNINMMNRGLNTRNSNAYKEYYRVATGATPPNTKASVWKTKSSSDTTVTPRPTAAAGTRLFSFSKDDDDDAQDVNDDQEDANKDDDDKEEGDDEDDQEEGSDDEQSSDEEGNGKEDIGMNVGREEGQDEEDEEEKLYKDVNINLGRGVQMADVHTTQEFEDSHVTLTSVNPNGQQQSSSVSSQFVTSMLNSTPDAGIESIFETTS